MSGQSNGEYPLGVLMARAQPFHEGHEANVRGAVSRCGRLAFLLGSSNLARSYKNPFTYEERREMVEACFPDEVARGTLVVRPMPDFYRDNRGWAENVKRIAREVSVSAGEGHLDDRMIALAGFKKDVATCEYLDMFPEWGDILLAQRVSPVDATAVREAYFSRESVILSEHLPTPVVDFMKRFRETPEFSRLVGEREEIDHCREVYNSDDPENHTGDILIRHRGKCLLIRRGSRYGHGLWAFPGGLRDGNEDYVDSSLRELDEETGLVSLNEGITIDMLKANVKACIHNDTKGRDLRGRYTTHLYGIDLPDGLPEPRIEPRDDAMHVGFVDPLAIPSTEYFADHHGMLHEALRQMDAA